LQLSCGTNKLDLSNATPRDITAPEHPSSTNIDAAKGKELASHSRKSSGAEEEDFSDQPSGTTGNIYKLMIISINY